MLDRSDVELIVDDALATHIENHHQAPLVMMPVAPFSAKLEADWQDKGAHARCQVVGVTPHGQHVDEDGMPMLAFVIIADLGDGIIAPRVVPTLNGIVPS